MIRSKEFLRGCRNMVPLIIGTVSFGIIFGTLPVGAGLSGWQTMAMSLLVFAGSAQFIAAVGRNLLATIACGLLGFFILRGAFGQLPL